MDDRRHHPVREGNVVGSHVPCPGKLFIHGMKTGCLCFRGSSKILPVIVLGMALLVRIGCHVRPGRVNILRAEEGFVELAAKCDHGVLECDTCHCFSVVAPGTENSISPSRREWLYISL